MARMRNESRISGDWGGLDRQPAPDEKMDPQKNRRDDSFDI